MDKDTQCRYIFTDVVLQESTTNEQPASSILFLEKTPQTTPSTMKISATVALAALVSVNAEVASARCFAWGWSQDNKEAKAWVDFACRGNGGMFTGNFAPGQTKSMCPKSKYSNLGTTKFEVQNQNTNTGFDLGDDDCVKRLYSEIDSCNWGGESSYSGWRFR
jgi:hypothetical protein